MIILTATIDSPARPSQGLATVTLPPASPSKSFKVFADDGHWALDAIGLHGLSPTDRKAVVKPVLSAVSELGPEAKAVVKTVALWQSSSALMATFGEADATWAKKLSAAVEAAGGVTALVKVLAPPIAAAGAFRFVDHTLTLGKVACDVYIDTTKKPEPSFGLRNAP